MDELFKGGSGRVSLPLEEERELLARAIANDGDAIWALLVQYRGILQKTANSVRAAVRGITREQIEDLQADLVLAAVEAIKAFDMDKFVRLAQVLPKKLQETATEMATSLKVPSGTLARWFKIWRAAEQDFAKGAEMAPAMGMTADTFRAIQHALYHVDSEWVTVPWSAGVPVPDHETHELAQYALAALNPNEREVIELVYGFRGDPKSDGEVADIVMAPRTTISKRRERGLEKMRIALA
ncbi:DNA binding protein [Microbacterium phage Albright]|uniref:DNA binding protein n=1 Tax=Microbacterium phage Albright TaxID=2816467 RepID=UPI0018A67680|nr:DNA binding protein [Microbacterium phage Albright]YP_010753265.1 helix-turn-helix DNA binding domain protein [Microbacterium phage DickRichards]QOP66361.1 helix-turn-helix DNA binding domain protein [Microbacterium phage DickRichards]QTF82218.1 DNA binding protein [Microbacterium phage Albright]